MKQRQSPPVTVFARPRGILAGFHAGHPERGVPELIHAGEQWFPMELSIPSHSHEVWELYYQIDGVSLWQSDKKRFELHAKHFFIAPPGVEHELLIRPTGKHHFFFAAIDLERVFKRLPQIAAAYQAEACRHIAHAESLEAPFRQLMREVASRAPYRAAALRAAVDSVAIESARLLGAGRAESLVMLHPGVQAVKDVLEHHASEPWTLGALGKVARLSPNHLAAMFLREIGMSPHQYLLRERVRLAKEVLRSSDSAITELALDLGFSSSQHFAKMFKQLTGTSARAYRDRARARRS